MQLSTQTDNYRYRKNNANEEKFILWEMGFKFETLNSTFYANEDIFDKKFKSSGVKRSMGAF